MSTQSHVLAACEMAEAADIDVPEGLLEARLDERGLRFGSDHA